MCRPPPLHGCSVPLCAAAHWRFCIDIDRKCMEIVQQTEFTIALHLLYAYAPHMSIYINYNVYALAIFTTPFIQRCILHASYTMSAELLVHNTHLAPLTHTFMYIYTYSYAAQHLTQHIETHTKRTNFCIRLPGITNVCVYVYSRVNYVLLRFKIYCNTHRANFDFERQESLLQLTY